MSEDNVRMVLAIIGIVILCGIAYNLNMDIKMIEASM